MASEKTKAVKAAWRKANPDKVREHTRVSYARRKAAGLPTSNAVAAPCTFCGHPTSSAKGLCHNCYARSRRNGTPAYQPKGLTLEQRFRRRYTEAGGCWVWKGTLNFSVSPGAQVSPRRYAYERVRGPQPEGWVIATCGNPQCVNPDHARLRVTPAAVIAEGGRMFEAGASKRAVAGSMRSGCATLEEIGGVLGVTRERARQLLLPEVKRTAKREAMTREWAEIEPLLGEGLTRQEIARRVGLSASTVADRIKWKGYHQAIRYEKR